MWKNMIYMVMTLVLFALFIALELTAIRGLKMCNKSKSQWIVSFVKISCVLSFVSLVIPIYEAINKDLYDTVMGMLIPVAVALCASVIAQKWGQGKS